MITTLHLFENLQQAEKLYFKTGEINPIDKDMILDITHGDNYTKAICDLFKIVSGVKFLVNTGKMRERLTDFYIQLKEYNKNIFPIKNFNLDLLRYYELDIRKKLLDNLKKLPSIGIRNLKHEIRQERTYEELCKYENDLEYFLAHLVYFDNRDEKIKEMIFKKMFKSGITLDELVDFVEEKENLLQGVEIDRNMI
jgi:hypothetical protein